MQEIEDDVDFSLALVDNGSAQADLDMIHQFVFFDSETHFSRNMGIAQGMNALLFGLCSASHFALVLEDDWQARNNTHLKFVSMAIRVLEHDELVSEVLASHQSRRAGSLAEWQRSVFVLS